ncbi:MAG: ribosome silencing factor [Bacteroidota bacterium]|nr:ribosome silencing factor [Bacteroidota bacterium]
MQIKQNISSNKLSKFIASCMNENKAEDIKILNLKKINNSVTDYFILCTGKSTTQIGAIADIIEKKVSKKFNEKPWKKEGKINKEWILIDFVNVVVHIFQENKRSLYNLEKLWGDAKLEVVK